MWSRRRNGSTMSRRGLGNVRRTTNPPPSTVRVAGTTLATERWGVIPGSRPVGRRLFHRGERLHRAGESVLPWPVPEEVLVDVVHLVVHPPVEVDAAREDAGHDAAGVVLLALLPGGVGRGHVLSEPGEDRAQLGLDRAFGLVVLDQVAVEEDEPDEVRDRREDRDDHPDTRVTELSRQPAEHGHVRGDALEVGSELLGDALLARPLPRELGRRLEEVEAAAVVVAHALHQLVEDVEAE